MILIKLSFLMNEFLFRCNLIVNLDFSICLSLSFLKITSCSRKFCTWVYKKIMEYCKAYWISICESDGIEVFYWTDALHTRYWRTLTIRSRPFRSKSLVFWSVVVKSVVFFIIMLLFVSITWFWSDLFSFFTFAIITDIDVTPYTRSEREDHHHRTTCCWIFSNV